MGKDTIKRVFFWKQIKMPTGSMRKEYFYVFYYGFELVSNVLSRAAGHGILYGLLKVSLLSKIFIFMC